jgi:hypothetical protein
VQSAPRALVADYGFAEAAALEVARQLSAPFIPPSAGLALQERVQALQRVLQLPRGLVGPRIAFACAAAAALALEPPDRPEPVPHSAGSALTTTVSLSG